jgi:hypothetical protein
MFAENDSDEAENAPAVLANTVGQNSILDLYSKRLLYPTNNQPNLDVWRATMGLHKENQSFDYTVQQKFFFSH